MSLPLRTIRYWILVVVITWSAGSLLAQVGINKDESAPVAFSIFSVKGTSGVSFYINDTSGHVGLSTLNAVSELTIQGNLKLQTPAIGSITDYLTAWSPVDGQFRRINTSQVASGSLVFRYQNLVVDNSPGTIWQDDFVFGSSQLDSDSNPNHHSRFFLDKGIRAFRSGYDSSGYWNADSLGLYSAGFGQNILVRGEGALAMGDHSQAIGPRSFASGKNAMALGNESTSFGRSTLASSTYSVAFGDSTEATNQSAIAWGKKSRATAQYTIAIGENNWSSFYSAMTIGKDNQSSSNQSSVFGLGNIESGGRGFTAGRANNHAGFWTFCVGDSNDATGYNSVVLGKDIRIADYFSTAIGLQDTTLEDYNTAIGVRAKASLPWATAIGVDTKADGNRSLAIGNNAEALHQRGVAIGNDVKSQSFNEVAIGNFNTNYSPISPWTWNSSQRLFVIGNGVHDTLRSDAMVILKNGNVGIGTSIPTSLLQVNKVVSDTAQYFMQLNSLFSTSQMQLNAYAIEQDSLNFYLLPGSASSVVIGTDSLATDHKLCVGGNVAVEEARTEILADWPDYVFEEEYKLPTANYLENYIQEYGHLPRIPSAEVMQTQGLDLTDMQIRLLEKIEELTLLIIEMEKKIAQLENEDPTKSIAK